MSSIPLFGLFIALIQLNQVHRETAVKTFFNKEAKQNTNPLNHPGAGRKSVILPAFYFWVPQVAEESCGRESSYFPVTEWLLCCCACVRALQVTILRGKDGYGFTICSDSPVRVQAVDPGKFPTKEKQVLSSNFFIM